MSALQIFQACNYKTKRFFLSYNQAWKICRTTKTKKNWPQSRFDISNVLNLKAIFRKIARKYIRFEKVP